MLKQTDSQKVVQIRENQVKLVDSLQKAEQSIDNMHSQILDRNKKQAGIMRSINQDIQIVEKQVDDMKNKIDDITSRILNLVEVNEQVNREVMNRQAAKVIQKCAEEIEQYQSKKQKDLQELKQTLNKIG